MNGSSKGPILELLAEVQWPFSAWLLGDQVLVNPPHLYPHLCPLLTLLFPLRSVALAISASAASASWCASASIKALMSCGVMSLKPSPPSCLARLTAVSMAEWWISSSESPVGFCNVSGHSIFQQAFKVSVFIFWMALWIFWRHDAMVRPRP